MEWLESAATMLSLYSNYKTNYNNGNKIDSNRLIKETNTIKHRIAVDIIKRVYSDLNDYNLFNWFICFNIIILTQVIYNHTYLWKIMKNHLLGKFLSKNKK